MRRAAVPLAGVIIVAIMLAGAYAMEAYVPAGAPRVVATWGTERGGRPGDAVEVIGLRPTLLRALRARAQNDTAWIGALRVAVEQPSRERATPHVIGRYAVQRGRIRFEPRFRFAAGVSYRVDFDAQRLEALAGLASESTGRGVTHRFTVPAATPARTTRVVAVHPTIERVPSNLLRWYVEFSAPMEPGAAHDHVRLLDETGRPVEGAFLRVEEELWDAAGRRLTLLFDPGRVKRGVRTHVEMGAPLTAGHRYRLAIDAAWPDARGAMLASGVDKDFDVGPADRTSPDPNGWTLAVPRAGTLDPLRVTFGEALDHALARRMVTIERRGVTVDGRVELADGDSLWSFFPTTAWAVGAYALRVDAALEDLAGNSVGRVFDADRRGASSGDVAARMAAARLVAFRVAP